MGSYPSGMSHDSLDRLGKLMNGHRSSGANTDQSGSRFMIQKKKQGVRDIVAMKELPLRAAASPDRNGTIWKRTARHMVYSDI